MAAGFNDGAVKLWDTKKGMPTTPLVKQGHAEWGSVAAFSADRSHLVADGHGENVALTRWDVVDGKLQETFLEPSAVNAVVMNPTKPIVASGGAVDKFGIHLRDMASGDILAELAGHEAEIRSLAFSPDGKLLVSDSRDKTVRIWEISTDE